MLATLLAKAPESTDAATDLDAAATDIKQSMLSLVDSFIGHLPLIGLSLLALVATWLVVKLFRNFSHRILGRMGVRRGLVTLVERLTVAFMWTAGGMLAAMIIFPGLTPANALAGLGIGSVAVGFAFKDIFENFLAGMLILSQRPFRLNDYIESGGIMGCVEQINVRNTHIRTPSGERIVVPNSFLYGNPVNVLTDNDLRRIEVVIGVAYGEDVAEAMSVLEGALDTCSTVDGRKPSFVNPSEFGASSVDIRVGWWCGPTPKDRRESVAEVVVALKKALDDAGIEIPFPYRTLTFAESAPIRMTGGHSEANGHDTEPAEALPH